MSELEWIDLEHEDGPFTPPLGATVYYLPTDKSYIGKCYIADDCYFYDCLHEPISDIRWWAWPSKVNPHIYDGLTSQQYSVAWGLVQEIINGERTGAK